MNTANKREMSEHAQVAKLCRQYCKSIGVKCKARSESYAGGDSVTVTIDDQPPHIVAQITNECKQYQYGHFDGMNDIYEYSNTDKNIPQTKFLFIQSHYSDELRQKAWSFIRNRFGVDQPEDYAEVNKYNTITDNSPVAIQEEVFRTLNGSEKCEFWDTLTTAQIIELPTQSDIKDIEISEGTKPGYSEIRF
ncbi:MAG: hypothetical protein OEX12_11565, partial [Gammaproteobacteria bacterium]|nr:hypothetical protein [Gammaproteobacteria bacterium]